MNVISYYGDLGIFLYFAPIVSSFTAAYALLCNRQRTYPQGWLAVVFITLGVGMVCSFVFDRYLSADHGEILRSINFITSAAASVSILFYYVSLMRPRLLTRKFILSFCGGWFLFALITALPDMLSPPFSSACGNLPADGSVFPGGGLSPVDKHLPDRFRRVAGRVRYPHVP